MHDAIWYGSVAGLGALLGLATLPWAHRIDPKCRPWLWVLAWACFWPYAISYALWHGFGAYRKAWWAYSDRRQVAKHLNQDDDLGEAIIKMGQTTRDTYFKQKK